MSSAGSATKHLSNLWELPEVARTNGIKFLCKIFNNILSNPSNRKYHSLKFSAIRRKLDKCSPCIYLLYCAGFKESQGGNRLEWQYDNHNVNALKSVNMLINEILNIDFDIFTLNNNKRITPFEVFIIGLAQLLITNKNSCGLEIFRNIINEKKKFSQTIFTDIFAKSSKWKSTNNHNGDDDKDNDDEKDKDNKWIFMNSNNPKKSKKKRIQELMSDKNGMSKRVKRIKWHKVPHRVFTKKSKTTKLQLNVTKMEFIKSLKQFIGDGKNNKLIQVLVDSNSRQPLYEYVWIARLALDKLEHDITIGIAVKYNEKLNDLQFTAIYLDKESILKQHKCVKSRKCHCLDGVKFGISKLIIHGQGLRDPFRQLVRELASKDCDITELKKKALELLANHQYNTGDDESIIIANHKESVDTQSDITNPVNVPTSNIATFNQQTTPLPQITRISASTVIMYPYPIPIAVNTSFSISTMGPRLNPYMDNTYYPPIQLPTSGHMQTSNQRPPQLQFPLLPQHTQQQL